MSPPLAAAAGPAALARAAGALRELLARHEEVTPPRCLRVPCEGACPEDLWEASHLYPRARLRAPRTGRHAVAVGALQQVQAAADEAIGPWTSSAHDFSLEAQAPVFFAARFRPATGPATDDTWHDVGAGVAFVPRLLLSRDDEGTWLHLYLRGGPDAGNDRQSADDALRSLCDSRDPGDRAALQEPGTAAPETRGGMAALRSDPLPSDAAERARFLGTVSRALEALAPQEAGSPPALQKVVLARRARAGATLDDGMAALRRLESQDDSNHACAYAFAWSPTDAYLGLTPELLYRRDGTTLQSEAVAGTRPRGRDEGEDRELEQELLHSDKERLEHSFVRTHIEASLKALGARVEGPVTPGVRRLSHVMHLVTELRATLPPGDDAGADATLIAHLHPTPALAGTPGHEALRFIEEHEGFDRGLYAGPLGVLEPGRAEVWIGLRGALAQGDGLTLFAGAGVVAASEPIAEWRETEAKMRALREALREGADG